MKFITIDFEIANNRMDSASRLGWCRWQPDCRSEIFSHPATSARDGCGIHKSPWIDDRLERCPDLRQRVEEIFPYFMKNNWSSTTIHILI